MLFQPFDMGCRGACRLRIGCGRRSAGLATATRNRLAPIGAKRSSRSTNMVLSTIMAGKRQVGGRTDRTLYTCTSSLMEGTPGSRPATARSASRCVSARIRSLGCRLQFGAQSDSRVPAIAATGAGVPGTSAPSIQRAGLPRRQAQLQVQRGMIASSEGRYRRRGDPGAKVPGFAGALSRHD
jgi:hypothetical protein